MSGARLLVALVLVLGLCAACGGSQGSSEEGGKNLLQEVKDRGVLRVSTDPAYPPQSFMTQSGEFKGFDIDVAEEIAKRMGVEVEWQTPAWEVITAGHWNGRWDVSVGSMTVTPRAQRGTLLHPGLLLHPGVGGRARGK